MLDKLKLICYRDNNKRKFKRKGDFNMFSLKKLGVTLGLCLGVILAVPSTVKAATENYWTTDGNKRYTSNVIYMIDDLTPDEFVRLAIANGSKADMQGKVIYATLQFKASSEKDAEKKIDDYVAKVKKAPSNRYGLSFGLSRDGDNYLEYDKKTKIATYEYAGYLNNIYYIQRLFDEAMNEPYLDVAYTAKDYTLEDKCRYFQKTRKVFKNATALKKASDSVKFQFLCEYLNGSFRMMYGKVESVYDVSLKAILNSECKGQCEDLVGIWTDNILNMVASDFEAREFVCWRGTSETSHACGLYRVKNKDGKWDYFTSNNNSCVIFGQAFLKEYEKKYDIYDTKNRMGYNNIEDWMHYDKKAYVTNKGEFGKSAYKYGKKHTKSELVKLMISKKAKFL